ncbi:hypothetical protein A2688_02045 [Candidatus Daviesbacteria bacterium RIFCSPHIGHO2_01_FULL_38_8]|nr:MAG: hypothetical protein A2688_02045 [Candidatus Daviesbacteria bacterium RIFCSPHIGHO2_01_FULL_38_8]
MNNGELPSPTPDSMSLKDQKKFGDVLNSAVQGAATSAEVNNGQQKKGGWVQKTWGRLKSRGQKDNGALQPAVGAAPENRTTSIKDGSVSPSKTTPAPTEASAASVSADELTKSQAQHGYESDQLMAAATGEAVSIADPYLAAAKQVEAATNRPVAQPTAETPSSVLTEQENPSIGELPTNRNFNVAEASQILGLNEHDTRIALRVLGAVEEDQNSGTYRVDQKNVEKFRVAFKGAVIDLRRSASAAPAPSAEPIVSAPEQAAAPAMVTTDHETPEPSSSSKTAATLMNLLSGSVVTDSSTLPGIHEPGELPPFLRGRSTPEPAASDESTTKKEGSIIAGFPTDRDFTAEDISRNLGLDEFTAKSFLEGLKIDGIVEEDKDSPGNYKVNQEKFRDAQGMLEATADSFTKAASPTGADTGPTAPIPGPDTAASAAPAEATAPAPDRGTASDPEPTATTTPAIETPLTPAEVEEINKWVSMLLSSNKDAQRTISFVLSLNPTVTSEQLQKRLKLNNNLADQARLDALISELQSRGMIQESTTEPGKFNVVKTTFESTVAPDSSAAGATTVVPENPPPSPIDSLPAEQKTKIQQLLTGKTIGVQELLKALDNDQDKVREIQSYLTGSGEYRYDARKQRFVKVTEALGTRIKNKLEAAGQNLTSRDFYIEAAKTYIDSLSWRGKSKVAYLTGLGVGVGAPILIASAGLTGGGTLVVGLGFAAAKLAITQIPAYALTRRTRKNIRKFAEDTFKPGESLSAGLDEAEQKKRVGQFVRQVYELTKRDHLLEKEKGKITERLHLV